ncbi:MAG: PaaI family thioesterase [Hyphomicrobiaceae bacterium]
MSSSAMFFDAIKQLFLTKLPLSRELDVQVEELNEARALVRMPYDAQFAGDPDSGALHGSFIAALLDTTLGMAVLARLNQERAIATVDLRIDYLNPSQRDHDLLIESECYRLTKNLAFGRGRAYHDRPAREIASAASTFIIGAPQSSQISLKKPVAP